MKKISILLGAMLGFVFFIHPARANEIEVKMGDMTYYTDNYDEKSVNVNSYYSSGQKISEIIDKDTGEVLETISLEDNGFSSNILSSRFDDFIKPMRVDHYTFRKTKSYGRTIVQISIPVQLYNEGSFRQVNRIGETYLDIINRITPTYIEGSSSEAYSTNGKMPTNDITYYYNATLTAEVSVSSSSSISAELLGVGFTQDYTQGGTIFYRKSISDSGRIRM